MKRISLVAGLIFLVLIVVTLNGCSPNSLGIPPKEDIAKDPQKYLEYCSKIKEDSSKNVCFADIVSVAAKNDIRLAEEACKLSTDSFREACYMDLMNSGYIELKLEDVERICGKIVSVSDRDACYRGAVDRYGISDLSLCRLINSEVLRNQCENVMVDQTTVGVKKDVDKSLKLCRELSQPTSKDSCFGDLAVSIASENPDKALEICLEINKLSPKLDSFQCFQRFLFEEGFVLKHADEAIKGCTLTAPKEDTCFEIIVPLLRGVSDKKAIDGCIKIQDGKRRDKCIWDNWFYLIKNTASDIDYSLSLCSYVLDKDFCSWSVALEAKKISKSKAKQICDKIKDADYKMDCLMKVEGQWE